MRIRKKTLSIKTLMSVSMALMISVFVLLTASLVDGFVSNAIRENAMDSASEIVTQVNNNLSTYIKDIIDVSDYVRELSRTTSNLTANEIQTRLEALINSRDDVVSITAFDTDGNAIISTEPSVNMNRNVIQEEQWFRRAVDGEGDFFFTGPHRSSTGNADSVISYSTVINYGDINREAAPAVLLIDLNFNFVEELLESAHLSETGYLYIISNDGDIVYHPKERLLDYDKIYCHCDRTFRLSHRRHTGSHHGTFCRSGEPEGEGLLLPADGAVDLPADAEDRGREGDGYRGGKCARRASPLYRKPQELF